jgi:tetratricopeptide (TPR) repeat protein
MRTFVCCFVLPAVLAVASVSFPTPTSAQGGQDAEARALFSAGEVAFTEGRFENALEYFRRSYELSHRADLLYNIGAACDRLRRDAEALAAFEQYLAERPDSPRRSEVEARLAVLRRTAAAATAATATTTAIEPTTTTTTTEEPAVRDPREDGEDTPSRSPSVAPWIVLGIGAAAAIAGGTLVGLAVADVGTVEGAPVGSMWSSVSDAYGRSEGLSIAGFVLLGVGGAAIAAGLGWGIVDLGSSGGSGETAPQARITIGPGGVSIEGSF